MHAIKLIDGSMYMYRAFYSIPMSLNSSGVPTNALLGFIRSIGTILKDSYPGFPVVFFDAQSNFRRDIYPQYKANRGDIDDALAVQFEIAHEFLRSANIPYFLLDQYEADDLIATCCAVLKNSDIYIYSSDKDFAQLLGKNISIINTVKSSITREQDFIKENNIRPLQFIDVQALAGDASDNVPGVKGIGIKTAMTLIQSYHTLENLRDNICKIQQKGIRNKLEQGIQNAFLSRDLVSLKTDVPTDMAYLESIDTIEINSDAILGFMDKYSLDSAKSFFINENIIAMVKVAKYLDSPYLVDGDKDCNASDSCYIKIYKNAKNTHKLLEPFEDLSLMSFFGTGDKYNSSLYPDAQTAYCSLKRKMHSNQQTRFYYFEKKVIQALRIMEKNGIGINIQEVKRLIKESERFLNKLENEIFDTMGVKFLISSPKQTLHALQDYLGIKIQNSDAFTLASLNDSVADRITQWRSTHKIMVDQLKSYLKLHKDGTIYPIYSQDTVITGRISASKPNIHNMPRSMKHIVIPKAENMALVRFDYSQLELRIAAYISQEDGLLNAFKDGIDVHSQTAASIFNIDIKGVTKEQRQIGKAINFSTLYGITAYGIKHRGYVDDLDLAKALLESYFRSYPKITRYIDRTKQFWQDNGFVTNIFGRRIFGVRNYRSAVNSPIQSSAADILKSAMIKITQFIQEKEGVFLITQIHDELIFEVDTEKLGYINDMKNIMIKPPILEGMDLKLEVDVAM